MTALHAPPPSSAGEPPARPLARGARDARARAAGVGDSRPSTTARASGRWAATSTEARTRRGWRCWRAMHGRGHFAVGALEDRDWVAQVRARADAGGGGAFHGLRQSRPRQRAGQPAIGLEIEAAQAFGTGHHATTQGCLIALDRLVRRGLVAAAGGRYRRRDRRAGDGGRRALAGAGDRVGHRSGRDGRRRGPTCAATASRGGSAASPRRASGTRG